MEAPGAEFQALKRTVPFTSAREVRGTLSAGQVVFLEHAGDAGA